MGLFFSNFHVQKSAGINTDVFQSALTEILNAKGYLPKNNPDEADLSISIYDSGEKWLSVCSDCIDFYTDESIELICNPISEKLSTDVLLISCFDSDCLLLDLINKNQSTVARAKIGCYPGLKARSTPARWKDIVPDIAQWKSVLGREYIFAEEALKELEPLLGLTPGQGLFCDELIQEEFTKGVRTLYFALPEKHSKPEPTRLEIRSFSLTPCKIGEAAGPNAVNKGGKSKGLAISFTGDYVENEEIRFRDVYLVYAFDSYPRKCIPIQLEKRKMQNGSWMYYAELPDFQIKEGVKDSLPQKRKLDEEDKRAFGISFTPEGNARKLLDITVHFIPMENPDGECGWCVWWYHGSKRAFIEEYNRCSEIMEKYHPVGVEFLNIEDYDIDE